MNGQKWARGGLVFGIIASITGNVANACLTPSSVSLMLLVPLAVVWPVGMFLAIEVLVRNRHQRGILARIGQAALLTVSVPTAVTSFVNLHGLMVKANESGIAQLSGPIAIDGLMMGCTIMLLASRAVSIETVPPPVLMSTEAHEPDGDIWERLNREAAFANADAPTSPAPFSLATPDEAVEPTPVSRRVSRGEVHPGLREAVSELMRGEIPIVREGASRATIARYVSAWRTLRDNPNAAVSAVELKVRSDLLDEMRAAARLEIVR
jgi:hypothetical protein